jgi:hypothetical protein
MTPHRLASSLFTVILAASTLRGQCPLQFREIQRKAIDPQLNAITSGDVDHDGVTDIVLLAFAGPTLYRGLPNGGFDDGKVVSTRSVEHLALADVNGDGNLDIILAGPSAVAIELGDGHGGFTERYFNSFSTVIRFQAIVAGHFTGSASNIDLLATDQDGSVVTFKGHGDGTFDAPLKQAFTVGAVGQPLVVDDLDRDGYDDVILAEFPTLSSVTILHNNGDGSFEKKSATSSGVVFDVAVADVNGDGIDDLVVVTGNSDAVMRGLGSVQYGAPVIISNLRFPPRHVRLADVNGDGNIDVITDDQITSTVVVAYGKGDATFPYVVVSDAAPVPITALISAKAGSKPMVVAIGYTSGELVTWQMVCQKRRAVGLQ